MSLSNVLSQAAAKDQSVPQAQVANLQIKVRNLTRGKEVLWKKV